MFPLAFVAGSLQGHWWGFISRNYVVWPIFFLMNVFIALKGTHFGILFTACFTIVCFLHYCIRFSPDGCLVTSLLIQHSSVLRWKFTLSVVGTTIVAFTSFAVWLSAVKWRDTGLTLFPCLMSVKCPRSPTFVERIARLSYIICNWLHISQFCVVVKATSDFKLFVFFLHERACRTRFTARRATFICGGWG